MIFAGLDSTNRFGFILFNNGGIVISSQILIFDIESKKNSRFLPLNLDTSPKTLEELRISIESTLSKKWL